VTEIAKKPNIFVQGLSEAGVHYGSRRARRHPSTKPFVFGTKNDIEIIDLEKTESSIIKAKEFLAKLRETGKKLLLVGNKSEARSVIEKAAIRAGLPYVALRWIGGTFTNFDEIRKRVERLGDWEAKSNSGELNKYTKKERARIAHEVGNLKRFFSGIVEMHELPGAVFVVDPDKESIAVTEAKKLGIPLLGLANTDCDISVLDYPIVGNDKSVASIKLIMDEIVGVWLQHRT